MLASGEADAHLLVTVSTPRGARRRTRAALIALAPAEAPVSGAAVTMAIGRPGVDHAGVAYAARTGTLRQCLRPSPPRRRRPRPCSARSPRRSATEPGHADPDHRRRGHRSGQWQGGPRRCLDLDEGRIVAAPPAMWRDRTVDAAGCVVMAGGIDIHSHIGGGNVNTARLLLPEEHRAHAPRPAATPLSNAGWSTFETGVLYAQDGLHHGGRAGDVARQRAPHPSRARRHPDHRQGDAGDPRQRRFPARLDPRRRRRRHDRRLCRLDGRDDAGRSASR